MINVNQLANQGLQRASNTASRLTTFQPRNISAANYNATGYRAPTIGNVDAINAQSIRPGLLQNMNIDNYMSPYTSNVIDRAQQDIERQRLMQQNQIGAQATAAGAFGGSRHGVAESLTNEAFARQFADTSANLRMSGFENAQQAALADAQARQQARLANQQANLQAQTSNAANALAVRQSNQAARENARLFGAQATNQQRAAGAQNRMTARTLNQNAALQGGQQRLQAASGLSNIANMGFGWGQTVNQNMMNQGLMQQMLNQGLIDAARNQFTGYANYPATALGYMNAALGATPIPQTSTSSSSAGGADMLTAAAQIAPFFLSDVRLKENIRKVGSHNGVNLYRWDWNEEGKKIAGNLPNLGVLAQDVAKSHPEYVVCGADGYLRVDYSKVMQ